MKKIIFFILLVLSQKTNAQSDEVVFNKFYNAMDKLNYSEAMSFYPAIKDALDKRYSYGDTSEFNIRIELFLLAKKVDSVGLMFKEIQRIEYLINKNYLNKNDYTLFIYNIYLFYRDQKNYQKCESLLNQAIENEGKMGKKDSQDMAVLLSDFAFIQGRLGNIEREAKTYLEAMPMITRYKNVSYVISQKYLLSCALFDLGRYDEQVIYGNECYVYFKNNDNRENTLSQLINLYKLAVSSDSIGDTDNAIKYSLEFLNLSVKYPEYGLDLYVDNIASGFNFLTKNIEQIVSCWEKNLEYQKERYHAFPNVIEYQQKVIDAYYRVSLYSRSFNPENSGNLTAHALLTQFDLFKSISNAKEGIAFCLENKIFKNDKYFDLQLLLIKGLTDIKSPEIEKELKKTASILKKYFKKDVLKLLNLNYWNSVYLKSKGEINKAEQKLLELEKSLIKSDKTSFEVQSILFNVYSDLDLLYYDKGDMAKSQYYNKLTNEIKNMQVIYRNDFADKLDLKKTSEIWTYSDSIYEISNVVYRYFNDNSITQIDLNAITRKLNIDLFRTDLPSNDKLEILSLLEYIYNKTENYVDLKNILLIEDFFRDSLDLWNDSVKVNYSISLAYVESALFNNMVAIQILEDAKKNVSNSNPIINRLVNNLSHYCCKIGDFEKSRLILEEELIRLRTFDNKRYSHFNENDTWETDYLLIIGNLGETCLALKKYKSAYSYLKESLELASQLHNENSPIYLHHLANFADLIMFSENSDQAEEIVKKQRDIALNLFSEKSSDYYQSIKQLFWFYYNERNYLKCDSLFPEFINTFQINFFEYGKGLNSKQFLQYHLFFLSEFSLFFEYGVERKKDREDFLEEALNLYLTMTKLLNKREKVPKSKDNVNVNLLELKANENR